MKRLKKVLMMTLSVLISLSMMGNTVWAMAAGSEANIVQESTQEQEASEENASVKTQSASDESGSGEEETEPDESGSGEEETEPDESENGEEETDTDESEDGDDERIDISSRYQIVFIDEEPFTVNIDGTPVTPEVDVTPVNDEDDDLTLDTDYTVDYEDNIKVGTATVVVTGKGRYEGELRKNFEIEKLEQDPDFEEISSLSLSENEEKKIDLSELQGDISVKTSKKGYVEVTETGIRGKYSVKGVKQGEDTLIITASGDEYYKEYNDEINITISTAEHHHTYLLKDENGAYTKYDTTKGKHFAATCKRAEYTLYQCEDCNYKEEVKGPSSELAPHNWGAPQASKDEDKEATYESAGTLVHVCTVCGQEENIYDWDEEDSELVKLVQRLKNDVKDKDGNVVKLEEGKGHTLTLSTYNDDEYGQFFTFVPSEEAPYQINIKEIEGADFEGVFVKNDVDLTEMSSAETLQAGKTYYICVRGTGTCEVSVSEVVKQTNIEEENYQVKFTDDLDTKEFEANGKPIEPQVEEVTPKYEDEEVTYNVSYANNVKPGTATISITGSGNYTGTIKKTFKIVQGTQVLNLSDITLAEGKETTIDLSELIGKIEVEPSEAAAVEVNKKEASGDDSQLYTVKALKAGKIQLTIKAAGDDCYKAFEKTINVYISEVKHHHTYLDKDDAGNYTKYKPADGKTIVFHAATCVSLAYTTYKCTDCGAEETIVDSKGTLAEHKYKDNKVVSPTCTSEGYTEEICTVCKRTQIKANSTVDKLEHKYIYQKTVPATGDSRAYNLYVCKDCNTQKMEYFGCVGGATAGGKHTFVSQVVKPTCTKDGFTKNTCTICGYSETVDETDALGHDMKETKHEATENDYGYTHAECSRCGYYVDTITSCKVRIVDGEKVFEHEGTPISGSDRQEDCTKPGTRKYKCNLCKRIYEKEIPDELPAKEHSWVVEEKATCEEDGLKICSVCKKEETLPKTGHQWVKDEANSRAATYEERGVTVYRCANEGCEQTKEDSIKRLCDEREWIGMGSKYLNISAGTNTHGLYYRFTPSETKNYFVTGNDVFETIFCEMDDDLTELGETALLTQGKTYYVCVNGDGQGNISISNVTDFVDIRNLNCKFQIFDDPASLVYTGEPIELDNTRLLLPDNTEVGDFSDNWLSYENNVNAGTATVHVTGKGKYTGTISKTFTIRKASQDIEEQYLDLQVDEIKELDKWEFFGNNISVSVPDNQKEYISIIPMEKGYKLQGKKVGKVDLHIYADGNENYEPIDVTIPVTIIEEGHIHAFGEIDSKGNPTGDVDEKKIISMIIQAPQGLTVGGSFEPTVDGRKSRVTLVSRDCEEGNTYKIQCLQDGCSNYTIQYTDDRREIIKDHVYNKHLTADGDYETDGVIKVNPTYDSIGKKEITCTVCGAKTIEDIDCLERVNLADLEVELSRNYFMYDGKEKRPSVKVIDEDEKAIPSNLYTVTYQNNKNPGANTAKVIVRANISANPAYDKYCGNITTTYSIVQSRLNKSKIVAGSSAKLTLKGIYSIDDYEMSRDGIISWNRKTGKITGKKAGKVKLTIYGYDKDDNDITVSVNMTVLPKPTAITKIKPLKKGKIKLLWKVNKTCGGYQIQYSLNKKFKKKVKTVKINKRSAKSVTIKGLKAKKVYYIRIRAVDSKAAKVVSRWSKVKKVKIQ